MKVIVYHRGYGCDTGCCGHTVEMFADDVVAAAADFDPRFADSVHDDSDANFSFDHPWDGDGLEFARKMVERAYGAEHVADLDWDHCIVTTDC